MAQIRPITSEALEAFIRNNLPSQNGFTEDLQASNVIQPVLNITEAAEGTTIGLNLQTALAFGSQTAFSANGTTVLVANTPGFYRIFGTSGITSSNSVNESNSFTMTDGVTTKTVWKHSIVASGRGVYDLLIDFTVFLAAGESISAVSSQNVAFLEGSSRQIADVNGNLVNPSGYIPQ